MADYLRDKYYPFGDPDEVKRMISKTEELAEHNERRRRPRIVAPKTEEDEETDREEAMRKLASVGVPVKRIEKASVLVDKWTEVREVYNQHVAAARDALAEGQRLAQLLFEQHGIKVVPFGNDSISGSVEISEEIIREEPRTFSIPTQRTVAEIRAESTPPEEDEKAFAQSIANGMESAMRALKF